MEDKKPMFAFDKPLRLLQENLSFLLESYRDFLSLLEEEKQLLITCDLKNLNKNRYRKELILAQIEEIEQRRVLKVEEIERSLGLTEGALNLQKIIQRFKGKKISKELSSLQAELRQVFDHVVGLNSENKKLVNEGLKVVGDLLQEFRQRQGTRPVYKKKGGLTQGSVDDAGRLMDCQG